MSSAKRLSYWFSAVLLSVVSLPSSFASERFGVYWGADAVQINPPPGEIFRLPPETPLNLEARVQWPMSRTRRVTPGSDLVVQQTGPATSAWTLIQAGQRPMDAPRPDEVWVTYSDSQAGSACLPMLDLAFEQATNKYGKSSDKNNGTRFIGLRSLFSGGEAFVSWNHEVTTQDLRYSLQRFGLLAPDSRWRAVATAEGVAYKRLEKLTLGRLNSLLLELEDPTWRVNLRIYGKSYDLSRTTVAWESIPKRYVGRSARLDVRLAVERAVGGRIHDNEPTLVEFIVLTTDKSVRSNGPLGGFRAAYDDAIVNGAMTLLAESWIEKLSDGASRLRVDTARLPADARFLRGSLTFSGNECGDPQVRKAQFAHLREVRVPTLVAAARENLSAWGYPTAANGAPFDELARIRALLPLQVRQGEDRLLSATGEVELPDRGFRGSLRSSTSMSGGINGEGFYGKNVESISLLWSPGRAIGPSTSFALRATDFSAMAQGVALLVWADGRTDSLPFRWGKPLPLGHFAGRTLDRIELQQKLANPSTVVVYELVLLDEPPLSSGGPVPTPKMFPVTGWTGLIYQPLQALFTAGGAPFIGRRHALEVNDILALTITGAGLPEPAGRCWLELLIATDVEEVRHLVCPERGETKIWGHQLRRIMSGTRIDSIAVRAVSGGIADGALGHLAMNVAVLNTDPVLQVSSRLRAVIDQKTAQPVIDRQRFWAQMRSGSAWVQFEPIIGLTSPLVPIQASPLDTDFKIVEWRYSTNLSPAAALNASVPTQKSDELPQKPQVDRIKWTFYVLASVLLGAVLFARKKYDHFTLSLGQRAGIYMQAAQALFGSVVLPIFISIAALVGFRSYSGFPATGAALNWSFGVALTSIAIWHWLSWLWAARVGARRSGWHLYRSGIAVIVICSGLFAIGINARFGILATYACAVALMPSKVWSKMNTRTFLWWNAAATSASLSLGFTSMQPEICPYSVTTCLLFAVVCSEISRFERWIKRLTSGSIRFANAGLPHAYLLLSLFFLSATGLLTAFGLRIPAEQTGLFTTLLLIAGFFTSLVESHVRRV